MHNFLFLLMTCAMLGIGAGCPEDNRLTEKERSKLDPTLQLLFTEDELDPESDRYDIRQRPDGTLELGVIITAADPERLREKGYQIDSVFGEMATARLTREEIREIVNLEEVRYVAMGERSYPQTYPDEPDAM